MKAPRHLRLIHSGTPKKAAPVPVELEEGNIPELEPWGFVVGEVEHEAAVAAALCRGFCYGAALAIAAAFAGFLLFTTFVRPLNREPAPAIPTKPILSKPILSTADVAEKAAPI